MDPYLHEGVALSDAGRPTISTGEILTSPGLLFKSVPSLISMGTFPIAS